MAWFTSMKPTFSVTEAPPCPLSALPDHRSAEIGSPGSVFSRRRPDQRFPLTGVSEERSFIGDSEESSEIVSVFMRKMDQHDMDRPTKYHEIRRVGAWPGIWLAAH